MHQAKRCCSELFATLLVHSALGAMTAGLMAAAAAERERMVIIGGMNSVTDAMQSIDVYDFATAAWNPAEDMPKPVRSMCATTVLDAIYVIGGYRFGDGVPAETTVYNLTSDIWFSMEPMSARRSGHAIAQLAGKIFAVGGSNNHSLASSEAYEPATNRWSPRRSMTMQRYLPAAAVLGDRLYVTGGYDNVVSKTTDTMEVYDQESDTWSFGVPMNTSRYGHCAATVGERFFVIGGAVGPELDYHKSGEVYDPKTKTWAFTANMGVARWGCAAVLYDGFIYVLGGANNSHGALDSVEVYDPVHNMWKYLASRMPIRRELHAAVLITGDITTVSTVATSTSSVRATTSSSAVAAAPEYKRLAAMIVLCFACGWLPILA